MSRRLTGSDQTSGVLCVRPAAQGRRRLADELRLQCLSAHAIESHLESRFGGKLFNDSISHRDYRAWEVVQGAPGTSRCDLASTHVKEFPQCEHRIPAETILKICEEAAKERPNLEWIEKIKSDAGLSHLNKSKDQLTSLAEKLQGLRQELNSLLIPKR